ncbi:hypothetical protein CB1_002098001 [Camelus ferus]|nr:hypothetical protein CB1_002098001 [Camelus ferus]
MTTLVLDNGAYNAKIGYSHENVSQLHVMDETHVINQVKEDVCYVSQDFYRDMDIARDRVYSEVRCLTPTDYDVSVVLPENPITYAWEGGKLISENDDFEDMVVTREDYEENGHSVCEEKFDI